MKFITTHAEQYACKYLTTYRRHNAYAQAAFFNLSMTRFRKDGYSERIENFFLLELDDSQAVLFRFANGDVFVISEQLTDDFVLKAVRYLGADHQCALYRLPYDHDEVAAILMRYLEQYKIKAEEEQHMRPVSTMRERFLDIEISQHLYLVLNQMRSERGEMKVLVIDDDDFALRLAQSSLGRKYSVDVAHSALEGFRKYACSAPDIIFLDINMPAVSGHDFLSKIFDLDPGAFVVVVSGHSDLNHMFKAYSLGARGFISKPYARKEMYDYIQQCNMSPEKMM